MFWTFLTSVDKVLGFSSHYGPKISLMQEYVCESFRLNMRSTYPFVDFYEDVLDVFLLDALLQRHKITFLVQIFTDDYELDCLPSDSGYGVLLFRCCPFCYVFPLRESSTRFDVKVGRLHSGFHSFFMVAAGFQKHVCLWVRWLQNFLDLKLFKTSG